MNKDILKKPVDVIDNGRRKHFDTREEAAKLYLDAMDCSDGSAKNRYATIYTELVNGTSAVVSDGEPELKERPKPEDYSLDDKDKIIKLIETNIITTHDLYDVRKGKLKVDDRDVIKALLKKDGWYAAQYMRKEIETDKELLMIACRGGKESGASLGYASDVLRNDKDFVMDLIKENVSNFRYASVILRNDPEVVSMALNSAFNDEKTFNLDIVKEHIGTELLVLSVNAFLEKKEKAKHADLIQELKEELLPQLQQEEDGYGNPIGFVSFGEETIELIFHLATAQYSATVHDKEGNPQLPHINGYNLDDVLMDCVTNYKIVPEREVEEKNSLDERITEAKEDVKPAKKRSDSKEKTK